ncbi:PREDICTED: RHOMBOID-like protein 1 [Ipomoea nil]|uniref:RHOMBOID-like protein 1 n=1 Tax=Ipomoea nil TaxID=35883 RepID=UPI000900E1B4|nr:PREDICTED: RHOMBOID-like protein 1 [Ipomoea nil]
MGRTPTGSSPESEVQIKVQPPRRTDSPQPSPPPGARRPRNHGHNPPMPPPSAYQPFKKWFPWLVPLIIFANIGFFVYSMYANNCPKNSGVCFGTSYLGRFAFQTLHQNPLLGPSSFTLRNLGALDVKMVVEEHQWWRLVTCMWLHAGVFHLAANMVSLLFVGIRLEQEFGFVRIGLLYILSGIGGSLASALFVRSNVSVGASGALFGLLGAMLSELLTNWTIYENKLATLLTLILIILINLAVGILPHVDNFAHLGGFLAGYLLGFVLLIRPQFGYVSQKTAPPGYFLNSKKSKYKVYQYIFLISSLILLIVGFAGGMVLLLNGLDGNEYCSWCHYLKCYPTPLWNCNAPCLQSIIDGEEVHLSCVSKKKTGVFFLPNATNSSAEIDKLCAELCT